ncbi:LacI family DNA-binding transcriptional regulator [Halalkalibacter oceani]|uniref:LacI family DNA-binding transcriptional regulator n=1 Tax=Halalkalibacter oceani TaxID=1653776 RepID=UPI003396DC39
MKITVNEIAKRAGVSQSTVSKVMNNYPQIKASTRQKVMAAIEELNFTPDLIARSLVTNKTKTIGLIVGDIANPFYSETAKVIISQARERGYDVSLSDTDFNTDNLKVSVKNLLARRVDGILIATIDRDDSVATDLYKTGFPIVLYNQRPKSKEINYVNLDDVMGAKMAVDHLITLGHRRISFITGPSERYSTFYYRHQGFKAALNSHHIAYDESIVYDGELFNGEHLQFVQRLLTKEDRPTGFFAASDAIAIELMKVVARSGLSVPGDVSIIGFGNFDISSNPFVNLTTIAQRKKEMASVALEKLLLLVENDEEEKKQPYHIVLEPGLIVRKTTGINYEQFSQ